MLPHQAWRCKFVHIGVAATEACSPALDLESALSLVDCALEGIPEVELGSLFGVAAGA